jgi:hemerythrin
MVIPDDLRLSVPRMDREHAALFQMAAELRGALDSSLPTSQPINRLLREFNDAVAAHFASEEEFMQSRGYPLWRDHAAEHQRLLEQLAAAKTDIATATFNPCGLLAAFVDVWYTQHILKADRSFAEYLGIECAVHGSSVPISPRANFAKPS